MKKQLGTFLSLLIFFTLTLKAQTNEGWFDKMYQANTHTSQIKWNDGEQIRMWAELRTTYKNHPNLLEMSWEERDSIWNKSFIQEDSFQLIADKYYKAYLISCKERGTQPHNFNTAIKDMVNLKKIRSIYLESRKAEYVILTPKAANKPQINGAAIFGVRPNHELIYKLPITGKQPLTVKIINVPKVFSLMPKQIP